MQYLPLFFSLRERSVLLVGGGEVAARKLESLLRAGASVQAVALNFCDQLKQLADAQSPTGVRGGRVTLVQRAFVEEDLRSAWLVIAATDNPELNEQIAQGCEQRRIWVNVVDQPALCSAIFPSFIDRDPVLVAISTGGTSPTLARLVRGWIEDRLPQNLGAMAEFLRSQRQAVADRLPDVEPRVRFWQRMLDGPVGQLLMRDKTAAAQQGLEQALAALDGPEPSIDCSEEERERLSQDGRGFVALVGAGPGDPELLTLKGLRLLRAADVVLYDNLANEALLDYARRDAEKIYVGKKRAVKGIRQDEINALLLSHAQLGRNVVRLKGGDPFIFGRGGEELAWLAEHGVDCLVVPGISAALGGASYAGIPLTHRLVSQSVRFVTGHRADDRTNMDWPELAKPGQTLVIYMGLPGLPQITQNLIAHGLPAATPAALIQRATMSDQKLIVADLATLAEVVANSEVKGPTLIIVGEVVAHRTTTDLQMPVQAAGDQP